MEREKLLIKHGRIRARGRIFHDGASPAEILQLRGLQQLHGDQNTFTWLGTIEQHNRLKTLPERDPPAVEVKDLRQRAVSVDSKLQPDACSGKIVAIKIFRHLKPPPEPDHPLRCFVQPVCRLPRAIVQIRLLPVGQIAVVVFPAVCFQ